MTITAETSHAARIAIIPIAPAIVEQVYQFIASKGVHGATAQEIEAGLSIKGDTIRPRLVTLREDRRIETLGEVRRTRAGRAAVVWVRVGL